MAENKENLKEAEKRPPVKNRFEFLEKIKEPLKPICFDIGVFTLTIFKKLPLLFIAAAQLAANGIKKLIPVFKTLGTKILHPFIALYGKICKAMRAIRLKAGAAYKRGGFKEMVKAVIRVFREGIERNYEAALKLRNYLLPVGGMIVLALTIFVFSQLTFGLVVEYDGVTLGCIKHENIYEDAEAQLMQRVLFEEDDEVEIVPKFKLAVVNSKSFLSSDQITDKLIEASSSVIDEASGLYVDGTLVGAVKEKAELQKTLDDILGKFATGKEGEVVAFVRDVQVKEGLYPVSSIMEMAALKEKITGETSAEIIYTVSKGDTPYDVARKSGISLDTLYSLNPIAKTTFVIGQKITIASSEPFLSVKVQKQVTQREEVNFNTVTTKNNNYYTSYRKVTRAGKKGINEVTYLVTYLNGVATEKELVETKVISAPVDEKVTVGTKIASNYISPNISASTGSGKAPRFIWPTSGRISCRWWGYYNHRGLDIAAPKGTPIYAAAAGTVISYRNQSSGYGKHIVIDHGNGVRTLYAHTSAVYVKVGDRVRQGQQVAAVGRTGWATGNHLHFGVMINGVYKNPEKYLP